MNNLKIDKAFYKHCSEMSKLKYYECFSEKQYIYKMKKVMKEVLEID